MSEYDGENVGPPRPLSPAVGGSACSLPLRTTPLQLAPRSSGFLSRCGSQAKVEDFKDNAAYSDDQLYRWWWERRWADGPGLCWVGLNPSTGDTTGRPRPTLRKVVALAKARGLGAVTVVNLFSWRATKPADLKRAAVDHDIVGACTNDVIVDVSGRSPVTLAAWGSHGALFGRGLAVADLLTEPLCLGVTASGHPRHPLYVPAGTPLRPFAPPDSTASE